METWPTWAVQVKDINGNIIKEQQYCPYDSLGMTRFILNGLERGIVTINGEEVIKNEDSYLYKKIHQ